MQDQAFRRALGEFGAGRYRDLVDDPQREPAWPLPIHHWNRTREDPA